MIDARKMAEFAIELLRMGYQEGLSENQVAALELAAAIMANHVKDWHFGGRATGPQFEDWKRQFPDWAALNDVANGTKHVTSPGFDPSLASVTNVEWEHDDFWQTAAVESVLRVQVDGEERSLRALTLPFAESYLERYPPLGD